MTISKNKNSSGSRGGVEGAMAPSSPVQISHKKDGRQRRPHRFHVSCPSPYPATGSDAEEPNFYCEGKHVMRSIMRLKCG